MVLPCPISVSIGNEALDVPATVETVPSRENKNAVELGHAWRSIAPE